MEYTVVVGSDPLADIVEQPVYLHAGSRRAARHGLDKGDSKKLIVGKLE